MISYFKLRRLLEKRGYQRKGIVRLAGISESTYQKLLASEDVWGCAAADLRRTEHQCQRHL